eukprot:2449853-Rhodomonas_salina.2
MALWYQGWSKSLNRQCFYSTRRWYPPSYALSGTDIGHSMLRSPYALRYAFAKKKRGTDIVHVGTSALLRTSQPYAARTCVLTLRYLLP